MKTAHQTMALSALGGVIGIALGYLLFSPTMTAEQLLAAERFWVDEDSQRLEAEDRAAMAGPCEHKSLKKLPSGLISTCGEGGWELPGGRTSSIADSDQQLVANAWNRLESQAIPVQQSPILKDTQGRLWGVYETHAGLKLSQIKQDLPIKR